MIYFSWNIYFVQDLIEIKVSLKTQTETQTETQTQAIDTLPFNGIRPVKGVLSYTISLLPSKLQDLLGNFVVENVGRTCSPDFL